MPLTDQRTDIYRHGDARVDIKVRPGSWFTLVRIWSGGRWPTLQRTYVAKARRWIPWFSLERQAIRAVEMVNEVQGVYLPPDEVRRVVRGALRAVL